MHQNEFYVILFYEHQPVKINLPIVLERYIEFCLHSVQQSTFDLTQKQF